MNNPKTVHIFAGPSLHSTPLEVDEPSTLDGLVAWHPPARRGDIEALISSAPPGVIGLADGTFHSYPSVAHVELREAMQQGWLVFGLCSMGAIRACEMAHMGMRPFGKVAQMFCDDPDFPDDEVALVHSTEPPYVPFSEPLVHLRAYLDDMQARLLLTGEQHQELLNGLQQRWYAERTVARLRNELTRVATPDALAELLHRLKDLAPYRLKQQDLLAFLRDKPWLAAHSL